MQKEKEKGLILCFEGIESCGKETQSRLLKEYLTQMKIPFKSGREPGGTAYGEAERRSLQDPQWIEKINEAYKSTISQKLNVNETLCSAAEMLGYVKSRAQFFDKVVKPAYDNGEIYILDRSGYSTAAYQGFGLYGGDLEIVDLIMKNNKFAMQNVPIARTWFIDITVEEMYKRKFKGEFGTGKDRIEQRAVEYFAKVRNGYLWLCEHDRGVRLVNGMRTVENIFEEIQKDANRLLESHGFLE